MSAPRSLDNKYTAVVLGSTALAAFVISTVPIPELIDYRIIVRAMLNAAHGPLFIGIALLAAWVVAPRGQPAWLLLVGALFGISGLTELVQGAVGRDPSWRDFMTNLLGVTAGLAAWAILFAEFSRSQKVLLATLLLACVGMMVYPVAHAVDTWTKRHAQFPTLLDPHFSDVQGMLRPMHPTNTVDLVVDTATIQVTPTLGLPAGVEIVAIAPDWQGYQRVTLDLSNPAATPLPLAILIGDFDGQPGLSDRFLKEQTLPPGSRQRISIPLTAIRQGPSERQMSLDKISEIVLFQTSGELATLHVHGIWLE